MGGAQPLGVLRGVRRDGRVRPAGAGRAAAGVRAGQGRVRGGVRGPVPAQLAADSGASYRPDAGGRGMDELISGAIHDPHAILGAHPKGDETVIRTLRRGASTVAVIVEEHKYPATRVHDEGVFEATVPGTVLDYRVEVDGEVRDDPYRHPPTVGELDLHLISEGRHERLWDVLGAHAKNGGVSFAVWAPNARGVRMVGDSTGWGAHDGWPMRSLGSSGVWEVFVPGIGVGDRYKYRILGRDGVWRDKADPMAQQTEAPPRTASIVTE